MDFVHFLSSLSSSDNNIRSDAEKKYQLLQEEGSDRLPLLLLQTVCSSSNNSLTYGNHGSSDIYLSNTPIHLRKLACILLRRLFIEQDESIYRRMSEDGQQMMKQGLLYAMNQEQDISMLSSITDLVGELAGYIMEQNEWPELMPYAYGNLQSSDPIKREMGLNLLGLLSNSHVDMLMSSSSNIQAMIAIFNINLIDTVNEGRLMIAAIRSIYSIVTSITQDSDVEPLQSLLEPIINCLSIIITSYHQSPHNITETTVISYIEVLIDIAESKISFIEYQLCYVMESILKMVETRSVVSSIRRMLLETLVTICITTPKKVRKMKSSESNERYAVIKRIVNVCIELMGQIPDEIGWESAQTIEDIGAAYESIISQGMSSSHLNPTINVLNNTEITGIAYLNSDCGETSLDRILPVLGVNCTLSIINQAISSLLQSSVTSISSNNSLGMADSVGFIGPMYTDWRYPYLGFRVLAIFIDISSNITKKKEIIQYCQYVLSIFDTFLHPTYYPNLHPRIKAAIFYTMTRFIVTHGKFLFEDQISYYHDMQGQNLSKINSIDSIASHSSDSRSQSQSLSNIQGNSNSNSNSNSNRSSLDTGKVNKVAMMTTLLQYILSNSSGHVNPSPRIRRNIIDCLMNFINIAPKSYLEDKIHTILLSIIQALSEGPIIVQEYAILAIISLSETIRGENSDQSPHNPAIHSNNSSSKATENSASSGNRILIESNRTSMAFYYDDLMPILKSILAQSTTSSIESLWGQTFECCAILGEASGIEKFHADAIDMMNILLRHNQMRTESEMNKHLVKAWVRIARCLGSEVLPYLPGVIDKLMYAILQDPSENTESLSPDECEERSDIHMIEREDGSWLAVRTAIVEEQALASQLLVQLIEKLQEYFYPHVEKSVRVMIPLLKSPHEDVRSYAIVITPELIRSTAKATTITGNSDRKVLLALTEYSIGQLLEAIESEASLELVMTGLQSLRMILHYACTDWYNLSIERQRIASSASCIAGVAESIPSPMDEPPALTPDKSIPILTPQQMDAITATLKIILKESIQRRGVFRAEAQISGGIDEDDEVEEEIFMHESLELHYVLSEVIGQILKSHGSTYYLCYMSNWHELISELCQTHCLKEDQQFALFVISDFIEFGLTQETAVSYFSNIIPMLSKTLSSVSYPRPRQVAAYAISLAAEKYDSIFKPYAMSVLNSLAISISNGDEDGRGSRGESTDNAVAAVGIILENLSNHTNIGNNQVKQSMDLSSMWNSWITYLPLKHDVEEGKKVIRQLLRLLNTHNLSFLSSSNPSISTNSTNSILKQSIAVLLEVYHSPLSTKDIDREIIIFIQSLRFDNRIIGSNELELVVRGMSMEYAAKLDQIMMINMGSYTQGLDVSPGPSTVIHDVLYRP